MAQPYKAYTSKTNGKKYMYAKLPRVLQNPEPPKIDNTSRRPKSTTSNAPSRRTFVRVEMRGDWTFRKKRACIHRKRATRKVVALRA
jgi:hypothetical protein